jgi:hypothetical protein
MNRTVLKQLTELTTLKTPQLKERWKELFGVDAPQYNRPFLIKRLAYRIQELTYGGLSEEVKQKLSDVLEATGHDSFASPKGKPEKRVGPIVGTKLVREFNGDRIEVTVVEGGFEYDGRFFRSLSGVAREVTGTNWNGPAFFGLRSDRKRKEAHTS